MLASEGNDFTIEAATIPGRGEIQGRRSVNTVNTEFWVVASHNGTWPAVNPDVLLLTLPTLVAWMKLVPDGWIDCVIVRSLMTIRDPSTGEIPPYRPRERLPLVVCFLPKIPLVETAQKSALIEVPFPALP